MSRERRSSASREGRISAVNAGAAAAQHKGGTPSVPAGGGGCVDLTKLSQQEYLDKFSVTAYLKDVVTLLLENRPDCPVSFITDYFKLVIQGASPLIRSYRYVRLTAATRQSFWDNLVSAFTTLDERKGGGVGVTAGDVRRLLSLLCTDFPPEIVPTVLEILNKTETCVVPFRQFAAGVYACVMYEEFFALAERLFHELDTEQHGCIPLADLRHALVASAFADTSAGSHSNASSRKASITSLPYNHRPQNASASPLPSHLAPEQGMPSPQDLEAFLSSFDGSSHVTFKAFVARVFSLTDPSAGTEGCPTTSAAPDAPKLALPSAIAIPT
ncbi:hypothetical protein DIPPA_25654 [Diplonema papillatum]|nr:hypothetical protein DIPPA_25654 [Diplonema papillatum]